MLGLVSSRCAAGRSTAGEAPPPKLAADLRQRAERAWDQAELPVIRREPQARPALAARQAREWPDPLAPQAQVALAAPRFPSSMHRRRSTAERFSTTPAIATAYRSHFTGATTAGTFDTPT